MGNGAAMEPVALRKFWVRPYAWQAYQRLHVDRYGLVIDECYEGFVWRVYLGGLIARGSCPTEIEAKTLAENFCLDHWRARTTA